MEQIALFHSALREAHERILNAHNSAVCTLKVELERMREENTLLRMRIAELHVEPCQGAGAVASMASCGGARKLALPSTPELNPASAGESGVSCAGGGYDRSICVAAANILSPSKEPLHNSLELSTADCSPAVMPTDAESDSSSVTLGDTAFQNFADNPGHSPHQHVVFSPLVPAASPTVVSSSPSVPTTWGSPIAVKSALSESTVEALATRQASTAHTNTASTLPKTAATAPFHHTTPARLRGDVAVRISGLRGALEVSGQEGVRGHEVVPSTRWEKAPPRRSTIVAPPRQRGLSAPARQMASTTVEICVCGHVFAADAVFCRKCGSKRPVSGDITGRLRGTYVSCAGTRQVPVFCETSNSSSTLLSGASMTSLAAAKLSPRTL